MIGAKRFRAMTDEQPDGELEGGEEWSDENLDYDPPDDDDDID